MPGFFRTFDIECRRAPPAGAAWLARKQRIMAGPLTGIRVLDLSRILAGPWATQVFADYGAEVIKVERPGHGDDTRQWGPPYLADRDGAPTGESAYYLGANRGKRSVTIDISRPEGQAIVRRLAAESDVVVENFRVGALARYGLDHAALSAVNPRLVYCSISAFGQDGPLRDGPGYDAMIQAMGGLMSITGPPEEEGGRPQKVGVAIADIMTGMYAVTAVLAALLERERSGEGQYIDLALLDAQVAWLANQNMNYLVGGSPPRRQGTAHPNIVPYQAFATRDSYIMIAVGNDRQFAAFARLLGHPDWADDPGFATNAARVAHRGTLVPLIEQALAGATTAEWRRRFGEAGIPCGPINDLAEVFAEPQVQHRGMRFDLPHPLAGTVPMVANPARYSRTPLEYRQAPPLLGEHTDEVLGEVLGVDAEALAAWRRDGIT